MKSYEIQLRFARSCCVWLGRTKDTTQAWFLITISWTAWSNEWSVSLSGVNRFIVIHCVLIATSKELRKRTTQKKGTVWSASVTIWYCFEDPLLSEPARLKSPLLVLAGPGSGKTHFLVKTQAAQQSNTTLHSFTKTIKDPLFSYSVYFCIEFTCVTCPRWVASAWRCLNCQWRHRDFEISTQFLVFHPCRVEIYFEQLKLLEEDFDYQASWWTLHTRITYIHHLWAPRLSIPTELVK